jgi:hypothetical protein
VEPASTEATAPTTTPAVEPVPATEQQQPAAAPTIATEEEAAGQSDAGEESISIGDPASEAVTGAVPPVSAAPGVHSGSGTVVVTVSTPPPPPPSAPVAEPAPPVAAPPVEAPAPESSGGDGESAAPEEPSL